MDLVSKYHAYFRVQRADTPDLIREAQKIRYDVYCREFRFEDESEHADGLEIDPFDLVSRHCVMIHKPSGLCVGCVRLVLANPAEPSALFPFEKYCGDSLRREIVDPATLPRDSFGEISRMAIRQEFRRRRGEVSHPDGFGAVTNPLRDQDRRHGPQMVLGLYLAAAAIGLSSGLESVFAMMEPRLARHLFFAGIRFEQVGDVIDYHRPRAAFRITRQSIFAYLDPEVRALLDTISVDLSGPDLYTERKKAQVG